MGAKYIGAHMPAAGGLHKAAERGAAIGCTAIQVFTSSPQMWYAKPVTTDMVEAFKKALAKTDIKRVVSHDSYLINLSSSDADLQEKSFNGLRDEMLRCHLYGIPWVVSHMGSTKSRAEEESLAEIARMALGILDVTPDDVTLLMETTSGQGSSLNYKFEQIAKILEHAKNPKRLGVCMDTCHIFAAGYDIRTVDTYERSMGEFGKIVGFDKLHAIHVNDSKKAFGSRVDRHANIGEGEIGPTAFQLLVNDKRFEEIPMMLETPDADEMHEKNLNRLKSYIHG